MARLFYTPIRIGDAERDAAVTALNRHYAEGRLTTLEHDERITLALAAATSDDLDRLFADLPPLVAAPAASTRRRNPFAAAERLVGNRLMSIPLALLGLAFALWVFVHLLPILAVIALVMLVRGAGGRRHFAHRTRNSWQGRPGYNHHCR